MFERFRADRRAEGKMGKVMVEMILGIILIIVGLAMANPLNAQITNITTGTNATSQGTAAVAMWGLVPLMLGVILMLIPLSQVFLAFKNRGN